MVLVDYDYRFIYADVGCQGRISDGGVFKNTEFYARMKRNELNLPNPFPLEGTPVSHEEIEVVDVQMVFVADEFLLPGYTEPYRIDRNCHGGGIFALHKM